MSGRAVMTTRRGHALGLVVLVSLWAHTCPPDDALITDVEQLFEPNPLYVMTTDLIASMPCDEELLPPVLSDTVALVVTALTGGTTFENEVHDCQRLIGSDGAYGSLMGVFPLDGAMALAELPAEPVLVATIYNWGVGPDQDLQGYPSLGIRDGMDWGCLWLDKDNLRAAIVEVKSTDESGCVFGESFPPDDDAFHLQVEEHEPNGLTVPPTARWRWDEGAMEHYIGVKCGEDWCSLFANRVVPTPERMFGTRRVHAGSYDEQRLAVADGAGNLRPGPLAWIAPTSTLGELRLADFAQDFQTVAEIEVDSASSTLADLDVYRTKYNLERVGGASTLYRAEVAIQFSYDPFAPDIVEVPDGAEFRNSTSGPGQLTLVFQPNESHAAMGSTRWRWLSTDEGPWVSCDEGCCTAIEE